MKGHGNLAIDGRERFGSRIPSRQYPQKRGCWCCRKRRRRRPSRCPTTLHERPPRCPAGSVIESSVGLETVPPHWLMSAGCAYHARRKISVTVHPGSRRRHVGGRLSGKVSPEFPAGRKMGSGEEYFLIPRQRFGLSPIKCRRLRPRCWRLVR